MQYKILSAALLLGTLFSCESTNKNAVVQGTLSFGQNSTIFFEKQPVHYKYAEKKRYPVDVASNNQFHRTIPVDSGQIVQFLLGDDSYPLYLQPGNTLKIQTGRGSFPDEIQIKGYPENWNQRLRQFFQASDSLLESTSELQSAFDHGLDDSLLYFYRARIQKARHYLQNTPFDYLIHKTAGEFLVKRLTFLKNQIYYQEVDPASLDSTRQQILEQARQFNFFGFPSLRAQRAGIYDFANAYTMSYGIEKKLEQQHEQDLMKYDVKRLAYPTIDSLKTSLLQYIDDRRARAYAQMHLVAERIGEMSIETATPSYREYMGEYKDFPRYTSFLKRFYKQRKRVSPGQPAVPFTLPDRTGQPVDLDDFSGKYVLLDFWASWCIPCLNEFPHMKELYKRYPRSSFEIIGISIEKDSLRWRRALNRFDLPWPQLYGGDGFQQETFSRYQAGGIPFYILIDPQGNIKRYNDIRPSFNLPRVLDSLILR